MKTYRRILTCAAVSAGLIVAVSAEASNVDHVQAPTLSYLTSSPSCWGTGYSELDHTCSGTDGVLLNVENISPGDNSIDAWISWYGSNSGGPRVCCQLESVNDDIGSVWMGTQYCTPGNNPGTWSTREFGPVYVPYSSPGTTLGSFGYSFIYCTVAGSGGKLGAVHYKD